LTTIPFRQQLTAFLEDLMTKHVEIIIYDAPAAPAGSCACGCGGHHHHGGEHGHGEEGEGADPLEGVSLELQARALALTLETAFPGQTSVEYINVLQDPRGQNLPQTALLCSLAYPTPLVYLNGQGRFAGALPVERLREEVGKLLEQD
jgi:hypothetical protein